MDVVISFLISFVSIFFRLLYWAIFIHVLMSWFAHGRTDFGVLVDQIVQPVLRPFRWARIGAFDLSPIVALFALSFLGDLLQDILIRFI